MNGAENEQLAKEGRTQEVRRGQKRKEDEKGKKVREDQKKRGKNRMKGVKDEKVTRMNTR